MASAAQPGYGTYLKIGDGGGPESFTTIAEVMDIKGPGFSLKTAEVTGQSSTGGWDEFIGTILSGGEVTFDMNWINDNTQNYSAGLLQDMVGRTLRNFQLVWSQLSNLTWTLPALVVKFDPDSSVAGQLKVSVTLKISGQPTLA